MDASAPNKNYNLSKEAREPIVFNGSGGTSEQGVERLFEISRATPNSSLVVDQTTNSCPSPFSGIPGGTLVEHNKSLNTYNGIFEVEIFSISQGGGQIFLVGDRWG